MGKLKPEILRNFPDLFMLACSDPYTIIALTTMEDKDRFQLRQQPQLSGSGPLEWWLGRLSEKESNG